jgi:hypothetical protein
LCWSFWVKYSIFYVLTRSFFNQLNLLTILKIACTISLVLIYWHNI